jgi:saccharopine dehydrogenase-like NADP-dependent oxidoreductase
VAEAAIEVGAHLVNTNYDHELRDLADPAKRVGVTILPEMGMDPGVDLVLCAEAVRRLDQVDELISYGGGVPEASAAADNPLRYKISWTWAGVLDSYDRPARIVRDGDVVDIAADQIFDERFCHTVAIQDLGEMEAFPNGDAVDYAQRLGIEETTTSVGRFALRWPGHCGFWKMMVELGFLERTPVPGLPDQVSPREFMREHLQPRLHYEPGQRDIAVIRVQTIGSSNGRRRRIVLDVIDYKDLATGLTAMSRTVGFSASIVAQMIGRDIITERGLLSPTRHVPYGPFVAELERRGIAVREREEDLV